MPDEGFTIHSLRQVAYMYGIRDVGIEPGGFIHGLLLCWKIADVEEHAKLSLVFPQYSVPMSLMKYLPNGEDYLRDLLNACAADAIHATANTQTTDGSHTTAPNNANETTKDDN